MCRSSNGCTAAKQLPPIAPCATRDAALEPRPPSVGGQNCGSGLGDSAGSLTVKLSNSRIPEDFGGDAGSPLWKLVPQQVPTELVSEATQRRLELAQESLRCSHADAAPQGSATGRVLPRMAMDVDGLLQHDAGLRMALALQGQSGAAGVQVQSRAGGLKMQRSRGIARGPRSESAMAAWKG